VQILYVRCRTEGPFEHLYKYVHVKFFLIRRINEIMKRKLNGAGIAHTDQLSTPHLRMLIAEPEPVPTSIGWTQTAHEKSAALRRERIEIVAYYLSEARGFAPGHAADDWLLAQAQVDGKDPGAFEG
jgi:Protein of unknown function (DUF2934)